MFQPFFCAPAASVPALFSEKLGYNPGNEAVYSTAISGVACNGVRTYAAL